MAPTPGHMSPVHGVAPGTCGAPEPEPAIPHPLSPPTRVCIQSSADTRTRVHADKPVHCSAHTPPTRAHTPTGTHTPPHTHCAHTSLQLPTPAPRGSPVPWFPLLPDLAEPGPMLGYPPPHVFHTPRHQRWGFREAPPGSCQVDLYGPPVPTAPLPCDLEKHLASPSLYFFICQMGAHGGRPHGGGAPSRARMVQNAWVL